MSRVSRPHLSSTAVAVIAGLTLALAGCGGDDESTSKAATTPDGTDAPGFKLPAPTPAPEGRPGKAVRAVDGDTFVIEIAGKQERVRLLGIDAPESSTRRLGHRECGGKMAAGAGRQLAKNYPAVVVSTDPSQPERDQHDRLLAYVVPEAGGRSWNTTLLRTGWGKLNVREGQDLALADDFREAAAAAEKAGAGVYSMCAKGFGQPE